MIIIILVCSGVCLAVIGAIVAFVIISRGKNDKVKKGPDDEAIQIPQNSTALTDIDGYNAHIAKADINQKMD